MGNWREEIFAYFDHRYTNATTEALNGVIKTVNRTGRAAIVFVPSGLRCCSPMGYRRPAKFSCQITGGAGISWA